MPGISERLLIWKLSTSELSLIPAASPNLLWLNIGKKKSARRRLPRISLYGTLVLLTLWYEFDTAVRDRGEAPPIRLSVERLNDSLKTKFEPLRKHLPSPTRLREILSLAQRKNLLRFSPAEETADAIIEVLPTLKRVIPFQDIADWNRHAERHLAAAATAEPEESDETIEESTP